MKMRKAFTLVELMVVIGVILLLAGLFLPMVNRAYHLSQTNVARLDLNAIGTALEAYHADFGDYPRNTFLPTWNYTASVPPGAGTVPFFPPLAAALIGPGPAVSTKIGSIIQAGDGAEGPGFRDHATAFPVQQYGGGTPLTVPTITITVTSVPPTWLASNPYQSQVLPLASIVISPGAWNQETEGIAGVGNPTPGAGVTLTFTNGVMFNHAQTDAMILRTATGKVWPPYLPPEKFKVQYWFWDDTAKEPVTSGTQQSQAYPVMLDRWGTPIQYFVRYGPNDNRTGNSVGYALGVDKTVTVGPLYGYSTPHSIDPANGQNAIWDYHYAIGHEWTAPKPNDDPSLTLLWMLGDESTTYPKANIMHAADTLHFAGDYILISAGWTTRWCNLIDPATGVPATSAKSLPIFRDSGNVYNFDR